MEISSNKSNIIKSEIKGPKIEEIKFSWKSIKSLYTLKEIFSFLNIKINNFIRIYIGFMAFIFIFLNK